MPVKKRPLRWNYCLDLEVDGMENDRKVDGKFPWNNSKKKKKLLLLKMGT